MNTVDAKQRISANIIKVMLRIKATGELDSLKEMQAVADELASALVDTTIVLKEVSNVRIDINGP